MNGLMSRPALTSVSHFPRHLLRQSKSCLLIPYMETPARLMSSAPPQRIFHLKLDPLTGTSEWVVIEEEDDSEHLTFMATTSYLDMLNDSPRNAAFRKAIEKTVIKPCHVLDIGAGTGLLSMMAARALESKSTSSFAEGRVTACESYLPMAKLMRKVLRANGMAEKVKLVNKRSDEIEIGVDMDSRADVLVSEILDSELLGEGLIPTLQHAHDMLLVENPRTVPYRAITYGQLVESPFLWKLHDLYNIEATAMDGIHLTPQGFENILRLKSRQHTMHIDAVEDDIKLMSEPFKIFEFDFWKRPESYKKTSVHVNATCHGRIDAVISWWILQLDSDGTIYYSTAPKWMKLPFDAEEPHKTFYCAHNWCDHWKQCVWFFPGEGISVSEGAELHIDAIHTDLHVSYEIKSPCTRLEFKLANSIDGDHYINLSPERVALYGDEEYRRSLLNSLGNALHTKVPSMCVIADDSIFFAVAINHLSPSFQILSSFPGLQEKGFHYLEAIAEANGYLMKNIEAMGNILSNSCGLSHKKVDLLIGEPFYYGCEAGLPWQNLRFWMERTALDSVLSPFATIIPCKGILKACAMSLPDLWRSRRSLKNVEGFDHSVVNRSLGACGDTSDSEKCPCLPFFVWQCGETMELSDAAVIMEFDFSNPIKGICLGESKFAFTKCGTCHGFVLWIDWVLDRDASIVISTGPARKEWKQGVQLVKNPVAIVAADALKAKGKSHEVVLRASLEPHSGELHIEYEFL